MRRKERKTKKAEELLGYCGLYCADCAGYGGEIGGSAARLKQVLEEFKFERTAKHLFSEKLRDYREFSEMLEFITTLRCPKICRRRTDAEVSCKIWKCCRDRGFYACYECDDFEVCEKLRSLEGLHGDACVKNLRAIREMGLENWIRTGVRYWFGSEVDGASGFNPVSQDSKGTSSRRKREARR